MDLEKREAPLERVEAYLEPYQRVKLELFGEII